MSISPIGGAHTTNATSPATITYTPSATGNIIVIQSACVSTLSATSNAYCKDNLGNMLQPVADYTGVTIAEEGPLYTFIGYSVPGQTSFVITYPAASGLDVSAALEEYSGSYGIGAVVANTGSQSASATLTTTANNSYAVAGFSLASNITFGSSAGTIRQQTGTIGSGGHGPVSVALTDNTSATPASVTSTVTGTGVSSSYPMALELLVGSAPTVAPVGMKSFDAGLGASLACSYTPVTIGNYIVFTLTLTKRTVAPSGTIAVVDNNSNALTLVASSNNGTEYAYLFVGASVTGVTTYTASWTGSVWVGAGITEYANATGVGATNSTSATSSTPSISTTPNQSNSTVVAAFFTAFDPVSTSSTTNRKFTLAASSQTIPRAYAYGRTSTGGGQGLQTDYAVATTASSAVTNTVSTTWGNTYAPISIAWVALSVELLGPVTNIFTRRQRGWGT